LLLAVLGCGGTVEGATPSESRLAAVAAAPAFVQPAGTVAVNFSVDDRANKAYAAGDLRWKGSFLLDEATRLLTFDPFWSGAASGAEPLSGWPLLHDDGPWTAGGHEPIGATAGDSVWGFTAFVVPPASGTEVYEYGLNDTTQESSTGGWIWQGPNGTFSVSAGATAPITAPGMTFKKFGTTDLVLTLDTRKLDQFPDWTWDLSTLTVKGSAWGWAEVPLTRIGRGQYVFLLSTVVGRHHRFPHFGLLNPGDVPEFVFVIGGEEYKIWYTDGTSWWAEALSGGVGAATFSWCNLRYSPAPIILVGNGNTAVVVPQTSARHCFW
jgi:hypothetical protein